MTDSDARDDAGDAARRRLHDEVANELRTARSSQPGSPRGESDSEWYEVRLENLEDALGEDADRTSDRREDNEQ